jgi:hypothetical protein
MESPLRKAVSPDGNLTLGVFADDDWYVGFEGQAWHTHGDLLVPKYGDDPRSASLAFFDSVLQDQEVICVSKRGGREEVWITEDAEKESRYLEVGEVLDLRLWSGRRVAHHENSG